MNNEIFEKMNNKNKTIDKSNENCTNENNLQIFDFEKKQIRTVLKDGEPWWVLKDVCDVLEIKNSRDVSSKLDRDDVVTTDIMDNLGRRQTTTVINEAALYQVIMLSRKPEAKKFMRWVTHEVLPSIRKHGAYMTPEKINEYKKNPEKLEELIEKLSQEQKGRLEAEEEAKRWERLSIDLFNQNATLQKKIQDDEDKVLFADTYLVADGAIPVDEYAKLLYQAGYDTGERRFLEWLRLHNFIIHKKTYDVPSHKSLKNKVLATNNTTLVSASRKAYVDRTIYVTPKGQRYLLARFVEFERRRKYEEEQEEQQLKMDF